MVLNIRDARTAFMKWLWKSRKRGRQTPGMCMDPIYTYIRTACKCDLMHFKPHTVAYMRLGITNLIAICLGSPELHEN